MEDDCEEDDDVGFGPSNSSQLPRPSSGKVGTLGGGDDDKLEEEDT